jgi:hypothetical protein
MSGQETTDLCFWCEATVDSNGAVDPNYKFNGYDPCSSCKGVMSQGITCFEVTAEQVSGRPPLSSHGPLSVTYVTRAYVVISEDTFRLLPLPESMVSTTLQNRICFIEQEIFRYLLKNYLSGPELQ